MRSLGLVSVLLAAPVLFANPCVTDTLANYIFLGNTGCTVGAMTAKDFNFTVISSTVAITASDITITPTVGAITNNLDFTSSLFVAGPTDSIKLRIDYFFDPGDLRGFGDVMNDPVQIGALSQLTIDGCEDSNFVLALCPTTPFTLVLAATNPTQTTVSAFQAFPVVVHTVGLRDTIEIDGNNCGFTTCADITDFTDTVQLPEPASGILILLPLSAGVLVSIKRRRLHTR